MDLCLHDIPAGTCTDCRTRTLPRGTLTAFFSQGQVTAPASLPSEFGPWFTARFDGACTSCGDDIAAGDDIRSDGHGGWLGECCGGDDEPPQGSYDSQGNWRR